MSQGFTNHGNTCYMNSALQCLSHLPLFHPTNPTLLANIKKHKTEDSELLNEWIKLLQQMWNGNKGVIKTLPLLKEFIRMCQENDIYFESFQQNDSADFIRIFIDMIHKGLKREVEIKVTGKPKDQYDRLKVKSIETWASFFNKDYSFIIKEFYSQTLSLTSCPKCEYITTNHEPMMVISLTLKPDYESIYDCLDEYIKDHILDVDNSWKCDKCSEKVCPHKKVNFWELSPILIFQIKQYRMNGKMNQHIAFPETLSMKRYCLNLKRDILNYSLSSLCIHSGGLGGGHYYAMCKDYVTNQWNIHNDSSVVTTKLSNVLQQNPYCLFYTRNH